MKTKHIILTTLFVTFICTAIMANDAVIAHTQKEAPLPVRKLLLPGCPIKASANCNNEMPVEISTAVNFIRFAGVAKNKQVPLSWTIIALKEIERFEVQRSTDNASYYNTGIITEAVKLNKEERFNYTDDISNINSDILYYRLKAIGKNGETKYSNVRVVRIMQPTATALSVISGNTARCITVKFNAEKRAKATIKVLDNEGNIVSLQQQKVTKGNNLVSLQNNKYGIGVYTIQVFVNNEVATRRLIINH